MALLHRTLHKFGHKSVVLTHEQQNAHKRMIPVYILMFVGFFLLSLLLYIAADPTPNLSQTSSSARVMNTK